MKQSPRRKWLTDFSSEQRKHPDAWGKRRGADVGARRLRGMALVCGMFVVCATVLACQVPVFRYALERWAPDRYQITVLSHGPLTEEEGKALAALKSASRRGDQIEVKQVDLTQSGSPSLLKIWQQNIAAGANAGQALILAGYPAASTVPGDQYACQLTLNEQNVAALESSPARKEIARRLADGQSAVWILLESDNDQKNHAARETLENQLLLDTAFLKLPSPEELEVDPRVLSEARIPLRIEFSVVTVRRNDPAEKFLVESLLNSEADLRDFGDDPLAFPIFGRGRVLYALVGKGIAEDTIRSASSFIVGPCSCQVKSQNPGFDLLLDHDWNKSIGDTLISDPLPDVPKQPTQIAIPPGKKSE
ncbi:MAG: hypothetical protein KDA96_04220 [Planctomycetaceae bacterium]|nr:hypothetical protein [Planctomycetaceae bacterium]